MLESAQKGKVRRTGARVGSWLAQRPLTGLLALALIFQLAALGWEVGHAIPRFAGDLSQPAWWRGAKVHQGRKFAQYIQFLRANIPDSDRVILPPAQISSKALAATPLMQFFLTPRAVVNCTDPTCVKDLSLENSYVLVIGDFPGPEALARGRQQMFDADWGVLLPATSDQPLKSIPESKPGIWRLALEGLVALLWLGGLTWAGALAVRLAVPSIPQLLRWALGFGLGLAAFSMLLGLASLAGLPIHSGLVLGVTFLLLVLAFAADRLLRRTKPGNAIPPETPLRPGSGGFHPDPWQAAFLVLGIAGAFLSAGQAYHASDEVLLWGAKGYGIATSGAIQTVTQWGTNTVPYPLHIPLLIAAARILTGDLLPTSKLVFPLYLVALMFLVYQCLISFGVRRVAAGLAALALGSVPLIFEHGTLAYANLPLTFYLVAGTALLRLATLEGDRRLARGIYLLSGLLFAGAAWTRPEGGVAGWLLVFLSIGLAAWERRSGGSRSPKSIVGIDIWALVGLILPLALYGLFWAWLKSVVYAGAAGRTSLVQDALNGILHLNLHLSALLYIFRSFVSSVVSPGTWGWLGIGSFLAGIIALATRKRRALASPILMSGLLYLALVAGLYYVTSFDKVHDISWWVNTGLDRMSMPGMVLLWLGGVAGAEVLDHRQDSAQSLDPR